MLSIHEKQGQPLYLQIYQQLKEDIRTGGVEVRQV